jgi:hypothetical protein
MNDKSAPRRSLREEYGGHLACWEERSEPIVSFVCADVVWGFPLSHMLAARYVDADQLLTLQWSSAKIEIHGPKALDFYKDFAKGKGTWCKADGKEILSVTFYSANVKKRRSSRPILARLIEGPLPLPSGNRDLETGVGEKRSVLFHLQVNRIWIRAGLDYLT